MSVLDQYRKKQRRSGRAKVVTARIPETIHEDFKLHCERLGLSLNEALNLLIYHELRNVVQGNGTLESDDEAQNDSFILQSEEKVLQSEEDIIQVEENIIQSEEEVLQSEENFIQNEVSFIQDKFTHEEKVKKKLFTHEAKVNNNRFTTVQYQVNGELFCPICRNWENSSNFSRHAKKHNTTPKAIYTNPAYVRVVEKAIKDRGE